MNLLRRLSRSLRRKEMTNYLLNIDDSTQIPSLPKQQYCVKDSSSALKNTAKLACTMLIAATAATFIAPQQFLTDSTSIDSITTNNSFAIGETQREKLVNEIKDWRLLDDNWDGEGGLKPFTQSIEEAISFVALLGEEIILPEPMLLSSGHTALFWNEDNLYADIEFLGDGRIAYFIKKNGDKHKGVLEFKSQKMPPVFTALLGH